MCELMLHVVGYERGLVLYGLVGAKTLLVESSWWKWWKVGRVGWKVRYVESGGVLGRVLELVVNVLVGASV